MMPGITKSDVCFLCVKLNILPMQNGILAFFNFFWIYFSAFNLVKPYNEEGFNFDFSFIFFWENLYTWDVDEKKNHLIFFNFIN